MRKLLMVAAAGLATLAASGPSAGPKTSYPPACATVNPVKLMQAVKLARKSAQDRLDAKDFYGYEEMTEKKTEFIVDLRLWQLLCTESN